MPSSAEDELEDYRKKQREAYLRRARAEEKPKRNILEADSTMSPPTTLSGSTSLASSVAPRSVSASSSSFTSGTTSWPNTQAPRVTPVLSSTVPPTPALPPTTEPDISNDEKIARALADGFAAEEEARRLERQGSNDDAIDPETAALIAQLLEADASHEGRLSAQGSGREGEGDSEDTLRPPDQYFQEQLIPSTPLRGAVEHSASQALPRAAHIQRIGYGDTTPQNSEMHSHTQYARSADVAGLEGCHSGSYDASYVPAEDVDSNSDMALALRLQEEEFLRDVTSPAQAHRYT